MKRVWPPAGRLLAAALPIIVLAFAATGWAQERPWTPLPSPTSYSCPDGLCQAPTLAPLFRALDGRWGGTVRIVQFGDSHTAGRLITGGLETRLKARFPDRDIRLDPIGIQNVTLSDLGWRTPPPEMAPVDLVILAYGTNEGFDDDFDAVAYARLLRSEIQRMRRLAPRAAILILSAPEAMRGDGVGSCTDDPERRWRAPVNLGVVRDVQRRVAAETNVAFWDWWGRMGGECSAYRLAVPGYLGPDPFMRPDHVHFTPAGADWIGSLLYDDLMTAGRAWYAAGSPEGSR